MYFRKNHFLSCTACDLLVTVIGCYPLTKHFQYKLLLFNKTVVIVMHRDTETGVYYFIVS